MDSKEAHKYSIANRTMLEKDSKCGCFYCCEIYHPQEIRAWIRDAGDDTAICPYCGIDSVIGESVGYPLTKEALKAMHDRWFFRN